MTHAYWLWYCNGDDGDGTDDDSGQPHTDLKKKKNVDDDLNV